VLGTRRVICLVVDALSASYLGPYGNTWIRTPAFNRLAAESLVFDRMLIETSSFDDAYASIWTGAAPWSPRSDAGPIAIAARCQVANIPSTILTDEPDLLAHPLVRAFDEVMQFPLPSQSNPATDWQETALAQFFAASLAWLKDHAHCRLLWLHTGALRRVWDAPTELREAYTDEDDPRPAEIIDPPSGVTAADADPDELLSLRHAYAGQMTVLDHCLRLFLDAIGRSTSNDSLLFALLGLRGYPLGEHGMIGISDAPLLSELTHCPCFIHIGSGANQGSLRSCALAQPRDLHTTICEWLKLADPRDPRARRPQPASNQAITTPLSPAYSLLRLFENSNGWSRLLSMAQSHARDVALVTPAWYFRSLPSDSNRAPVAQIFAKPDDYFEANEVSARCQDEVAEFQEVLRQIQTSNTLDSLSIALSHRLVYGVEAISASESASSPD
jgi:arylsulfatase A-like enzyme